MNSNYLSALELADLVNCKVNQRKIMEEWLSTRRWKFELDKTGLPKVARVYHDRKMGISDEKSLEKSHQKYAETPNLSAFS
jgi:hypothetical protein